MSNHFHAFVNNKIKILAAILLVVIVVVAAPSLLFIFPIVNSTFANSTNDTVSNKQSAPLSPRIINQTPVENNDGVVIILKGVTLIDGTGALPKANTTIVINGSKIASVYNNSNTVNNYSLTSSANVINLTGKYIIPGLFDMHAHVAGVRKNSYNQTIAQDTFNTLLAYGVTTIRNPGGPTEQSVALKENVSEGKITGPQIFTAGQLLNTPQIPIPFVEKQVETEQDVRQEIRSQLSVGVDYAKLYVGLTPELVQAAIDEAHSHGIKVIGHLYLTSWTDAANLGIDALAHGVPVSPFLLSEENQQKFLEAGDHPFNHFLWLDLVDLNGPEIREMISELVKNEIPVDPTLSIYEAMIKDEPDNQYLWPKVLQLTKMFYDNGVTILSGSDIPNFELVPGASLHRELEILVEEADIPLLEVIKIATSNGAQALGILNEIGTIEAGKQADMIILSDNPVDDISNTKKIEAVMADGRFVDRKLLLDQ
jgi:imidazolonepropionase-like amidohydrolase